MFGSMADAMYRMHYKKAIGPNLSGEVKKNVADRISTLTLKAPVWDDRETDWIEDFPELRPYVNAKLSGLYLCSILGAIVDEFRAKAELTIKGVRINDSLLL